MTRSSVRKLAPYVPGTTIEEVRRRLGLDHIVKLASNENPLGSSPKALAALRKADKLNLYFDDAYPELRERIGAPYGLRAQNVVLGHGSNELVKMTCETILEPDDEVVFAQPGFLLYPLAIALRGAHPVPVPLKDGVHDVDRMLDAVGKRTALFIICDPNNPTATALGRAEWERVIERLPERVTLLVDQAYREYMGSESVNVIDFVNKRPNTIVLRTMSKIYGLASLRFGYAFSDPETAGWLNRVRLPFNVSRPAALGAAGALDDHEFVAHTLASNEAGKAYVFRELRRLGVEAYPSQANFYAARIPVAAHQAYDDLLQRGIIVRSGDALGMPEHIRVTIGTAEQNAEFIQALEELLPAWQDGTRPPWAQ